ncbi:MAG: hypothetical protein M2R45_00340 [Verrucomicrobia subdivision 3 bacterium]|nr:hypothetical protein [Limisphaerales bacterium]MCS1412902.1 hypothetical protein [Limisphaerales bacterium]
MYSSKLEYKLLVKCGHPGGQQNFLIKSKFLYVGAVKRASPELGKPAASIGGNCFTTRLSRQAGGGSRDSRW